jgi:hypothetical protein
VTTCCGALFGAFVDPPRSNSKQTWKPPGRPPYRYANGDADIPEPAARLLRLLVLLRLTLSERKFEDILKQLNS